MLARFIVFAGALLVATAATSAAQARLTGADLDGTVGDQTAGVVRGCTITVTNVETNISRNVFAIQLPPLRERREDILPLSDAFLAEIARGIGRPPAGISRDARKLLTEYAWPGNVRELRNILERAAILCDGGLITGEYLALTVSAPAPAAPVVETAPVAAAARPSSAGDLQSMERAMIEQALQNARFNKSKAAKALGLTRQQLYVRMRKYDLA